MKLLLKLFSISYFSFLCKVFLVYLKQKDNFKSKNTWSKEMTLEDDYRKKMIKAKEDYEKFKEKEGDSDLIFNKKDNQKSKKWLVLVRVI